MNSLTRLKSWLAKLEKIGKEFGVTTIYKHLNFVPIAVVVHPGDVVPLKFDCRENDTLDIVGSIQWNPLWKSYCFYTANPCSYPPEYLSEISSFLEKLNSNAVFS